MCSGMLIALIYWFQVWCIAVEVGAVSFGSFLLSVFAGWRSVALRVLSLFGVVVWGLF